jgi:hypothetical protein
MTGKSPGQGPGRLDVVAALLAFDAGFARMYEATRPLGRIEPVRGLTTPRQ